MAIIACLYAKPHINNKEVKLRIKPVWWMLVQLQLVNLLPLLRHNISLSYYKKFVAMGTNYLRIKFNLFTMFL